ncbi:hypothetical protein G7B40_007630 [Aetokthonos hydrillicola Thurmond2011]|uniref:Uncharacterized protein n=1 Tax=Aetokthonos hydrillicola Thurmond2011 TaxID=2712845 RepID=A0AAP5I3J9_9CYAN|nr:hypothetical protein [Aetokthonos hydrillicola]MBW4587794.1 hypothetical protein [Aetokthonos hydrillicola CCALA 1050]MDR9894442.1 hypothetical protein [Aetokthonos hydrillicola Thurmond2011]
MPPFGEAFLLNGLLVTFLLPLTILSVQSILGWLSLFPTLDVIASDSEALPPEGGSLHLLSLG